MIVRIACRFDARSMLISRDCMRLDGAEETLPHAWQGGQHLYPSSWRNGGK